MDHYKHHVREIEFVLFTDEAIFSALSTFCFYENEPEEFPKRLRRSRIFVHAWGHVRGRKEESMTFIRNDPVIKYTLATIRLSTPQYKESDEVAIAQKFSVGKLTHTSI